MTLCRPPVNALRRAEYDALAQAFTVDGPDAPRVVLLRAEGRVWCAGQDLDELGSQRDPAAYLRDVTRGVATTVRCPVPVVVQLDGPAIGAGALLVACADIVISTPQASVALPELRVGMRLGRSLVTGFLPARLATYALATGALLDADRLHGVGAVAEVVPAGEAEARVSAIVAELLSLSDDDRAWLRSGTRPEERARSYETEVAAVVASVRFP